MKKERAQGIVGRCIFCDKIGSLSKEHLWPEWMHEIVRLPSDTNANRWVYTTGDKTHGVHSRKSKERQGHVTTKKFRVVCKTCNETWMSGIEEAAKPLLIPLISGQPGLLTGEMQATLATWATLKVMVAEQNQPLEQVFDAADRAAFKNDRVIPAGVRIWIARCFSNLWRNAFMRCSGQVGLSDSLPPRVIPADDRKNIQTSAFGVGELFIYTTISKASGIDLEEIVRVGGHRVGEHLVPICPSVGDVALPLRFIITEDVADVIAIALNRLLNSEHVHHFDLPA